MRRHPGRSNWTRSNLSMHWRRRISCCDNAEALSKTIETGGENLFSGLTNLLNDLQRGKGRQALP